MSEIPVFSIFSFENSIAAGVSSDKVVDYRVFMRISPLSLWPLCIGILSMAGFCASENRATAVCGDYVHILAKNAADGSEAPVSPPKPCNGKSCEQAPIAPAPMPIPTTPTSPTQSLDAILSADAEFAPHLVELGIDPEDRASQRGHLEAIFHPPR